MITKEMIDAVTNLTNKLSALNQDNTSNDFYQAIDELKAAQKALNLTIMSDRNAINLDFDNGSKNKEKSGETDKLINSAVIASTAASQALTDAEPLLKEITLANLELERAKELSALKTTVRERSTKNMADRNLALERLAAERMLAEKLALEKKAAEKQEAERITDPLEQLKDATDRLNGIVWEFNQKQEDPDLLKNLKEKKQNLSHLLSEFKALNEKKSQGFFNFSIFQSKSKREELKNNLQKISDAEKSLTKATSILNKPENIVRGIINTGVSQNQQALFNRFDDAMAKVTATPETGVPIFSQEEQKKIDEFKNQPTYLRNQLKNLNLKLAAALLEYEKNHNNSENIDVLNEISEEINAVRNLPNAADALKDQSYLEDWSNNLQKKAAEIIFEKNTELAVATVKETIASDNPSNQQQELFHIAIASLKNKNLIASNFEQADQQKINALEEEINAKISTKPSNEVPPTEVSTPPPSAAPVASQSAITKFFSAIKDAISSWSWNPWKKKPEPETRLENNHMAVKATVDEEWVLHEADGPGSGESQAQILSLLTEGAPAAQTRVDNTTNFDSKTKANDEIKLVELTQQFMRMVHDDQHYSLEQFETCYANINELKEKGIEIPLDEQLQSWEEFESQINLIRITKNPQTNEMDTEKKRQELDDDSSMTPPSF